jgi:hypothetical protein
VLSALVSMREITVTITRWFEHWDSPERQRSVSSNQCHAAALASIAQQKPASMSFTTPMVLARTKLTSMLCSDLTSHWCISQVPGRFELAASCHTSDAVMGSRTAAITWSPRRKSCRTNSRPIPVKRHSGTSQPQRR